MEYYTSPTWRGSTNPSVSVEISTTAAGDVRVNLEKTNPHRPGAASQLPALNTWKRGGQLDSCPPTAIESLSVYTAKGFVESINATSFSRPKFLSSATRWHGFNNLHSLYGWVPAVRGAGEVSYAAFPLISQGLNPKPRAEPCEECARSTNVMATPVHKCQDWWTQKSLIVGKTKGGGIKKQNQIKIERLKSW